MAPRPTRCNRSVCTQERGAGLMAGAPHAFISFQTAPRLQRAFGTFALHSQIIGARGPIHLHGCYGFKDDRVTSLSAEVNASALVAVCVAPRARHGCGFGSKEQFARARLGKTGAESREHCGQRPP